MNLDIPYFIWLLLVVFMLEHNVDKKSMRNIDVRIHVKLEVKEPIFWTHPLLHPTHTSTRVSTHTKTHTHTHTHKLPTQKFRQKILTHATHVKLMTQVKNILTHVSHGHHVNI